VKQVEHVKIFCSYAHEDQLFAQQLKVHFALLGRLHSWVVWSDTEICAGEDWEKTIQAHLDAAQIILLLVSADFIASDYCYSKEMQRAMERHERKEAYVIPILIRAVANWQQAPFGKLQVLPADDKPITDRYWHTVDEALAHVVKKISQAISIRENHVRITNIVDQVLLLPPPTQVGSEQSDTNASSILELPSASSSLVSSVSVQIKREGIKIFEHQQEAYHFLINMINRKPPKNAVLLQYSCKTSLGVLQALLRKGTKVRVFIQHEDTPAQLGSQWQADRIEQMTMNLREELGDALVRPNKLEVYKYHAPSSMSAVKLDNRVLCMGWYTYEEGYRSNSHSHLNDTLGISGHDRAAVVVCKGTEEFCDLDNTFSLVEGINNFNALAKTFRVIEKNYLANADVVPV